MTVAVPAPIRMTRFPDTGMNVEPPGPISSIGPSEPNSEPSGPTLRPVISE